MNISLQSTLSFVLAVTLASALAGCDGGSDPSAVDETTEAQTEAEADDGESSRALPVPPKPEDVIDSAARTAVIEILDEPDPFTRARRLGELLPTWGADKTSTVRSLLDDPALNLDATSYDLLARTWATHTPDEACHWLVINGSMIFRQSAVLETFTMWARIDPVSAEAAMDSWTLPYADLADILRTGLVRGWYQSGDIAGLEFYMVSEGPGLGFQRILSQYMRTRLQAEGPEAVMAWAEAFPDDNEPMKKAVYRQTASNLPLFDFDASLEWCERHCDGPYGNNIRNIIARRLVRTNGASALDWLAGDYPGAGVDRDVDLGLRMAFARWASQDREAAVEWGNVQTKAETPVEWIVPMLPVYVRMIAGIEPEHAIALTNSLIPEEDRPYVLTDIARSWLKEDPAAAEVWLETSGLSDDDKANAHQASSVRPMGD